MESAGFGVPPSGGKLISNIPPESGTPTLKTKGEGPMTAIEFLKTQHREAIAMIETLEQKNGKALDPPSLVVFGKLKSALVFHTAVEEQIFYHELANNEATKDLIHDAYQEHRSVDELMVKLTTATPDKFSGYLSELKQEIAHHVDEEENDLFPKAEALLGAQKLEAMGRQLEQVKKGKSANLGKPFKA
jgi:hemerythrin superfamily protein